MRWSPRREPPGRPVPQEPCARWAGPTGCPSRRPPAARGRWLTKGASLAPAFELERLPQLEYTLAFASRTRTTRVRRAPRASAAVEGEYYPHQKQRLFGNSDVGAVSRPG